MRPAGTGNLQSKRDIFVGRLGLLEPPAMRVVLYVVVVGPYRYGDLGQWLECALDQLDQVPAPAEPASPAWDGASLT